MPHEPDTQAHLFDVGAPVRAASSRRWTPEEDALLTTYQDDQVADRTGRTLKAVAQRRSSLRMPYPCRHPGCTKPRRRVQGGRYCDDHARSRDYAIKQQQRMEEAACQRCGERYARNTRLATPLRLFWESFCPACRQTTPLKLDQIKRHNVPFDMARAWIMQGSRLRCDICGVGFRYHGTVTIDHDHGHCDKTNSCGACVRGVLCGRCNTRLDGLEAFRKAGLMDTVLTYLHVATPSHRPLLPGGTPGGGPPLASSNTAINGASPDA